MYFEIRVSEGSDNKEYSLFGCDVAYTSGNLQPNLNYINNILFYKKV